MFQLSQVSDAEECAHLKRALTTLDFTHEERDILLGVVAAVLHLGQLQFTPTVDEGSSVDDASQVP